MLPHWKSIRSALAGLAGLSAIALSALPASAGDCAIAETVKGAANAFIRAAKANTVSAFGSALDRYTNVEELALFALGKYRSRLPAARKGEFVSGARRYMSQFLADNAGRFKGTNLTIESCAGDQVKTSLAGSSEMTWRVAGDKIKDVRVSGIWLALQLRQNFGNVIKRTHGDVGELVDYLAQKNTADSRPKQD